jgi:hypothetical protein
MPEEKGEIQAAGYISWNHAEAQTAYALSNHFEIMANAFWSISPFINDGKRTFFEGGLGYYSKIREHQYVELFCGYGYANESADEISADEISGYSRKHPVYYGDADFTGEYSFIGYYHRVFLQPTYTLRWNPEEFKVTYMELDFTLRTSMIYYPRYNFEYWYGLYSGTGNYIIQKTDTLSLTHFTRTLLEPAITCKGKVGAVKGIAQLGIVIHPNPYVSEKIFHPVTPVLFLSFGVQLDIKPSLFKRKNTG